MKENIYNLSQYRRAYDRFSTEDSADVIVNNKSIPSILKNLSVRGAGVVLNQPLDRDKEVAICIKASAFIKKPIYRKARVAWCKAVDSNLYAAGLCFSLFDQISFA